MTDNIRLTGNVTTNTATNVCGAGICFCMASGKDLNLNGYTISCTNNCGNGVYALAAGTDVINGSITGYAMALQGVTGVDGVTTNGSAAIEDEGERLKTVTNSSFTCPTGIGTGRCINATMPRGTDEFSGNTVVANDRALRIVGASSGLGPTIEDNYLSSSFTGTPGVEQVGATKKLRMYGNEVYGDPPFDVDNSDLALDLDVWNSNICEDTYYCPPTPTCSNGGDPVCHPDGIFCTAN